MRINGWMMLRGLVNQFHKMSSEAFLKRFPSADIKEILKQEVPENVNLGALLLPLESLDNIHYSWLLAAIQKLPLELQACSLSALSKTQAAKIAPILKKPLPDSRIALPIRRYILKTLYDSVAGRTILPCTFLPESALSPLATLKKSELLNVIDFLGIYDLSEEVRHLIDKKRLAAIHAAISVKQRQFLALCLQQKAKIVTPRLELQQWDGSRQQLDEILHRRGLIRISKALYGQHPDLIWHISHKMDSGRGAMMMQHLTVAASPTVLAILIQQVMSVLKFIKAEPNNE